MAVPKAEAPYDRGSKIRKETSEVRKAEDEFSREKDASESQGGGYGREALQSFFWARCVEEPDRWEKSR